MPVSLSEIGTPDRVITVRGRSLLVNPIDGYGMQLLHTASEGDRMGMIRASYQIAARCTGLTFDELFGTADSQGLSEEEVAEVLATAQRSVKRVEATAPPNSEPAGERSDATTHLPAV